MTKTYEAGMYKVTIHLSLFETILLAGSVLLEELAWWLNKRRGGIRGEVS